MYAYHIDPRTGLICMAAKDASDVILRLSPTSDDAIPNAHPVFLSALVRLAGLTGDDLWLKRADELFTAVSPHVRTSYVGHAGILNALDLRLRVVDIVAAGPKRQELYDTALSVPFIERIVVDLDKPDSLPENHPAKAQVALAGEAAAFICSAGTCSLPVGTKEGLQETLAARGFRP
jgi:uncharacterized protein YyaL (SSP411 family)